MNNAADVRYLHEAKSGAVLELWVQKITIIPIQYLH